jgi:hypothetical protein
MAKYDDMMELDMYDMEGFYTGEQVRDSLIAAAAGAGSILLAAWAMPHMPAPAEWAPENKSRMRAGLTTVAGLLIGRGLWDYNRDAAMAVIGGVAGLGLAQLADSFFPMQILGGTPLGTLPEDIELSAGDEALLEAYDSDGMSALAALETPGVTTAPGAFSGFADPTVTPEALMGFAGTVVQSESLGYSPYMA